MCSKSSAALRFSGCGGGLVDVIRKNSKNKGNEQTPAGPRPCFPVLYHERVPRVEAEEVGVLAKELSSSASGYRVRWRNAATVPFEAARGEIVGWLLAV